MKNWPVFPSFYFRQYRAGECVFRYCRKKERLSRLLKQEVRKAEKLRFLQKSPILIGWGYGLLLEINGEISSYDGDSALFVRAIFVWPWNENAQTKQKQQTNENRAIWLVYRTDMNARGFWLVKRTLGWKNFMPENFLEINRYFALTSHCNTIGQSNNAFSILGCFFGGKTKRPCFDLFIHWLIKQITNA